MKNNVNGYEFKREIERIFKVARNMYPEITDNMLDTTENLLYDSLSQLDSNDPIIAALVRLCETIEELQS